MINFKGFASLEKLPEKLYIYTGVFLQEYDRAKILEAFPPKHPNVYADHVTFWFKPNPEEVRKIYEMNSPVTQEIYIKVVGYAEDEKAQAILVEFPHVDLTKFEIKNKLLHITISCADGVSPAYSNELLEKATATPRGVIAIGQLGVCSHADRAYLPQGMWKRRGL